MRAVAVTDDPSQNHHWWGQKTRNIQKPKQTVASKCRIPWSTNIYCYGGWSKKIALQQRYFVPRSTDAATLVLRIDIEIAGCVNVNWHIRNVMIIDAHIISINDTQVSTFVDHHQWYTSTFFDHHQWYTSTELSYWTVFKDLQVDPRALGATPPRRRWDFD